jgi:hypothetical protein
MTADPNEPFLGRDVIDASDNNTLERFYRSIWYHEDPPENILKLRGQLYEIADQIKAGDKTPREIAEEIAYRIWHAHKEGGLETVEGFGKFQPPSAYDKMRHKTIKIGVYSNVQEWFDAVEDTRNIQAFREALEKNDEFAIQISEMSKAAVGKAQMDKLDYLGALAVEPYEIASRYIPEDLGAQSNQYMRFAVLPTGGGKESLRVVGTLLEANTIDEQVEHVREYITNRKAGKPTGAATFDIESVPVRSGDTEWWKPYQIGINVGGDANAPSIFDALEESRDSIKRNEYRVTKYREGIQITLGKDATDKATLNALWAYLRHVQAEDPKIIYQYTEYDMGTLAKAAQELGDRELAGEFNALQKKIVDLRLIATVGVVKDSTMVPLGAARLQDIMTSQSPGEVETHTALRDAAEAHKILDKIDYIPKVLDMDGKRRIFVQNRASMFRDDFGGGQGLRTAREFLGMTDTHIVSREYGIRTVGKELRFVPGGVVHTAMPLDDAGKPAIGLVGRAINLAHTEITDLNAGDIASKVTDLSARRIRRLNPLVEDFYQSRRIRGSSRIRIDRLLQEVATQMEAASTEQLYTLSGIINAAEEDLDRAQLGAAAKLDEVIKAIREGTYDNRMGGYTRNNVIDAVTNLLDVKYRGQFVDESSVYKKFITSPIAHALAAVGPNDIAYAGVWKTALDKVGRTDVLDDTARLSFTAAFSDLLPSENKSRFAIQIFDNLNQMEAAGSIINSVRGIGVNLLKEYANVKKNEVSGESAEKLTRFIEGILDDGHIKRIMALSPDKIGNNDDIIKVLMRSDPMKKRIIGALPDEVKKILSESMNRMSNLGVHIQLGEAIGEISTDIDKVNAFHKAVTENVSETNWGALSELGVKEANEIFNQAHEAGYTSNVRYGMDESMAISAMEEIPNTGEVERRANVNALQALVEQKKKGGGPRVNVAGLQQEAGVIARKLMDDQSKVGTAIRGINFAEEGAKTAARNEAMAKMFVPLALVGGIVGLLAFDRPESQGLVTPGDRSPGTINARAELPGKAGARGIWHGETDPFKVQISFSGTVRNKEAMDRAVRRSVDAVSRKLEVRSVHNSANDLRQKDFDRAAMEVLRGNI